MPSIARYLLREISTTRMVQDPLLALSFAQAHLYDTPSWNMSRDSSGVDKRVVFQKDGFLADVPPERKPERGYIRMFPRNENWNEGTFAGSPRTKTRTRVHSPKPPLITKPPFYLPVNSCAITPVERTRKRFAILLLQALRDMQSIVARPLSLKRGISKTFALTFGLSLRSKTRHSETRLLAREEGPQWKTPKKVAIWGLAW